MKERLPDALMSRLSELVAARTALHFPREKWGDLERRAGSAAKEFGFAEADAFIRWLVSSPLAKEQLDVLASHLTIGETYFWREPRVFEALGERILPELIRSREKGERRLRIWSAGCATGEEPYSIAIALRRVLPDPEDWHVTILATDINPGFLRKAAAGVYGAWSFRNAPPWLKEGCFRQAADGRHALLPEIREMVTFAYLNLAQDIYPSTLNDTNAMDLVFCRNVLMYFSPERAGQVGQRLYRSLVDGGWLAVGASELSLQLFGRFAPVHFPGTILYGKDGRRSRSEVSQREGIPAQEAPARASRRETSAAVAPAVSPPAATLPARALANQGRLAEALAACDEALAAEKLDPGLHYLRATILQEQGGEKEAVAALKRALYIEPDFVLAHFALGNLAHRRGSARTARRCFENALALLSARRQEDILPESEGLTAGRFTEIIRATLQAGALK